MSNYSSLKATINANVKTNGNQEITGAVMNSVLNAMVNSLGAGYQYKGIATPTSPGSAQTPDYNCFYLASTPGTYTNLGGLVVNEGEVCALVYNGSWSKEVTGAATTGQVRPIVQMSRTLEEISNALLLNEGNKFAISDKYGNIVGYFDSLGLHVTDVRVKNEDSLLTLQSFFKLYKDDSFLISDMDGNLICSITKDGIKATKFEDKVGGIGHNIYKGFQLISVGDSLSAGNNWQLRFAQKTGCDFDASANIKSGEMISAGGTMTSGGGADSAFFRVLNLFKQNIVKNQGENTIIIFENVNDFYEVGQPGSLDDDVLVPTTPIETNQPESNFNAAYLDSIKDEYGAFNAILSFYRIVNGKKLTITSAPTTEGDVTLSVGRSGPGIHAYSIHVVPQATEEETIAYVVDKILEYAYSGVSDYPGENPNEVLFTSGTDAYPASVAFTDTGNTGMEVSITDTSDAKLDVRKYFIGESLSDWSNLSFWKSDNYLTLYRAWKSCIQFVIEKYPKAKVFVAGFPALSMNPNDYLLPNGSYDHSGYQETSRYLSFEVLYGILKDLCDYYSIPYLDIAKNIGINVSNYSTYYNNNNVHPKPIGYDKIADVLVSEIQKYI